MQEVSPLLMYVIHIYMTVEKLQSLIVGILHKPRATRDNPPIASRLESPRKTHSHKYSTFGMHCSASH